MRPGLPFIATKEERKSEFFLWCNKLMMCHVIAHVMRIFMW